MTATTLEEFQRRLREEGAYHSDASHCAARRVRPCGWLTARFSLSVTRIFPMCALWQAVNKLTPQHWAKFCFSSVTMPESCGMRLDIDGWRDRAAYKGPVVYLCNHMSSLETVLLPPILQAFGPFRVVMKAALGHLPFLEKAAVTMGTVLLSRKDPRADLLALYDAGAKHIGEGASFLIFPQGTRMPVFARNHFSSIGAKLAEKCGVPIVPIAVDTRCMPLRTKGWLKKFFRDFGPVDTSRDIRMAAGPLIMPAKSREMHEQSFNWIAGKLEEWGLPVEREKEKVKRKKEKVISLTQQ